MSNSHGTLLLYNDQSEPIDDCAILATYAHDSAAVITKHRWRAGWSGTDHVRCMVSCRPTQKKQVANCLEWKKARARCAG
jgi:hypothetical protein